MKYIINYVRRTYRNKPIRAIVCELVLACGDRRLFFANDVSNGFGDMPELYQNIAKRHAEWIAKGSRSNIYSESIINALANRAYGECLSTRDEILANWFRDPSDAAALLWTSVSRLEKVLDRAKQLEAAESRFETFAERFRK